MSNSNVCALSWIEYGSLMAIAASLRSKDPSTKVGSVIMNRDNKIIGTGYNGFPPGFPDTEENWQPPQKYETVIHAEMNCIFNAVNAIDQQCKMIVTLRPCTNCAKHICATKIKEVFYLKHRSGDCFDGSDDIFSQCGVKCVNLENTVDINRLIDLLMNGFYHKKQ